ncbi:carbamoylphosphate synthase large subunit [Camillea tinctor]|nr:carbamoylphosphate synthase large subunit [Camillea tinctor]
MASLSLHETLKCFGLVLLSTLFLPASLIVTLVSIIYTQARPIPRPQLEPKATTTTTGSDDARPNPQRTILVTGVSMAKGLTLARAFYLSGHRVIGADTETHPFLIPCPGRFSASLSSFHRLPNPSSSPSSYTQKLISIIRAERVDLWVSCSGVASAAQDAHAKEAIEAETSCPCVQLDSRTTAALHEKGAFARACKERGLPTPETHEVQSSDEIMQILYPSTPADEKPAPTTAKFILKPTGVNDAHRANMMLLPLSSAAATRAHLSALPLCPARPWILQRYVPGGREYCTHALVVRGEVVCFAACASAELLMHYEALAAGSALGREMRRLTARFAAGMTGHVSFDFMVDADTGAVYAIECNPRAHTAVVVFAQPGVEMEGMVRAYLEVIDGGRGARGGIEGESKMGRVGRDVVMPPPGARARYWIGHDLVSLLIQPTVRFVAGRLRFNQLLTMYVQFLTHILLWKEGTFEAWDPLPALVLYHVYWPSMIVLAWWQGRRWSRVNVSTTKMFLS